MVVSCTNPLPLQKEDVARKLFEMVMRYMSIADTRLFGLMCRSPKSERVFEFINLDQKLKVTTITRSENQYKI